MMENVFALAFFANILGVLLGAAILLVAALAAIFRRLPPEDTGRLALWGGALVLVGVPLYLLLLRVGAYCTAGCG